MKIITEEMKYRKRLCDFSLKHGVTKAARRYHTNGQTVYQYDGTVRSLALKSIRPKSHPNQHTKEELDLLDKTRIRYGHEGYAELYIQAMKRGYKRSYGSMSKQIRKLGKVKTKRKLKTSDVKHNFALEKHPGDKVQVDIKYVPMECLLFNSYGERYYQITAIDEYSRKRVLEIFSEKSTYSTSEFVKKLEARFGFKIETIQTDNGPEFVNTHAEDGKSTLFDDTLRKLNIKYKRTRPYSPWQNGKVERSHKLDNERFYNRQEFCSKEDMNKKISRYNSRYNNISRKILDFKSSNQIIESFAFN